MDSSDTAERCNRGPHKRLQRETPVHQNSVTDFDRAGMLREYLDAVTREFGTTPKLMPLGEEGKEPVIEGRCRLHTEKARRLLVDGYDAVDRIRTRGDRGFCMYAGKPTHGTEEIVFIDHDDLDEFPAPTATPTLEVRSGGGGMHETYRNAGDVANARVGDAAGEVRALNWYVILPGSIHSSGGVYHIAEDRPIATLADADLDDSIRPSEVAHPDSDNRKTLGFDERISRSELPEKIDPEKAMKDVKGTDSFSERWERVRQTPWERRETFIHLLNGDHAAAGYVTPDGQPDRSAGELTLARFVGFWFDRDPRLARFIFEVLSDVEKYHQNPRHRHDMFAAVRGVEWTYTDTVSLDARLAVADVLHERETAKKATIDASVPYSDKTVERVLRYFREEDAVELDRRGQEGAFWVDRRLGAFIDAYDSDVVPADVDNPVSELPAD